MKTLKGRLLGALSREVRMAYMVRDTMSESLDAAIERNATLRKQLDYALKEREELEKEIARLRAETEEKQ